MKAVPASIKRDAELRTTVEVEKRPRIQGMSKRQYPAWEAMEPGVGWADMDCEPRDTLGYHINDMGFNDDVEEIRYEEVEGEAVDSDPEEISNAGEDEFAYFDKIVLFEEAPVEEYGRKKAALVHRDEFVAAGPRAGVEHIRSKMHERYDSKVRAVLGTTAGDDQEIVILGRPSDGGRGRLRLRQTRSKAALSGSTSRARVCGNIVSAHLRGCILGLGVSPGVSIGSRCGAGSGSPRHGRSSSDSGEHWCRGQAASCEHRRRRYR